MINIRTETEHDLDPIRVVNRHAFGREDEARLVDALRDGEHSRISLVAEVDVSIVGYILFSDLKITTATGIVPALALAPMAVMPNHQRRGIGSELVRRGLVACQERGHGIVIVLGHPDFYARFGFSRELTQKLQSPYSCEAFMAIELIEGSLEGITGTVQYPLPFDDA